MSTRAITRLETTPQEALASRATSTRGVAIVVAFWWLTTGVLLAAQRSAATRVVALVVATALAGIGARWISASRNDLSPAGATQSFFGGALLWFWIATLLYGGWVVGIVGEPPAADLSRAALAGRAILATLFNDVLGIGAIGFALYVARGGANRAGAFALLTFWCTHQLAKLNVFAGVVHPGAELLPSYLRHLERYFGPPVNSLLLWPSVVALFAISIAFALATVRGSDAWRRRQAALLAALVGLAAIEHLLLGVQFSTPLWDVFLSRARG